MGWASKKKLTVKKKSLALCAAVVGLFVVGIGHSFAQTPPATNAVQIVELQGAVEILPAGSPTWIPAQKQQTLQPFDRIHTAANSRVALRWSDQSIVPFGAATELEILPPDAPGAQAGLHLIRGVLSFFHRDQPGRIRIITRGAVAGVEGTEFILAVNDADATTLSVVDGKVKFGNAQSMLALTNGEQAVVALGQTPTRTAGFSANNLLQWCFYYPAVIDADEIPFTADEQKNLTDSLAAYRAGDLLAALKNFPATNAGTDAVKIYHAALLLAVGEVAGTETELTALPKNSERTERTERLANALRQLIAAVKRQPSATPIASSLTSELLAASYFEQSRAVRETSLQSALRLAKQAATNSPNCGFAWARVAELEFSFGRTKDALTALDQSLARAPRNAQALALKGFILAEQNNPRAAIASFDAAIAADSALGNAWLGRGLSRICTGDLKGGRADLLVAAALEPQRAELRSYLGKAYLASGDDAHAAKELALAKKLDPNDPTAWLYSALANQQENQINDAIRDLEKSASLNDNRSVYRSGLLLDEDQAVRSANLASVYRDAGMTEVSVREAGRAVNSDYANYSAHLFLAQSYAQLLAPSEINRRYETPAQNEYLLANLLAPTSAGLLSPNISQGDYTKLFEQNRFGVASDTEYLSRDAWTESGAQYGTCDNFSYALEAFYHSDPGQTLNSHIYQRQLSLSLKDQLTPQDSVFFNVQQYEGAIGGVNANYNEFLYSSTDKFKENPDPTLILGYHHAWSPGVHTLLLAGRLEDSLSFRDPYQLGYLLDAPDNNQGVPTLVSASMFTSRSLTQQQQEIYSGELQQIWEGPAHTTILGSRLQYGDFDTTAVMHNLSPTGGGQFPDFGLNPLPQQDFTSVFQRISVYGYHQWQIFEPLQLIGGVTYDQLTFPKNSLMAPISGQDTTTEKFSPKAGLIWTPADNTTFRFAYTRSLSGAAMDQSYQIEPSQVAGFVQTYRSPTPQAIAGGNLGAEFETYDLLLEQKFPTGTYLSLAGELLNTTQHRVDGAFTAWPDQLDTPFPSQFPENLKYQDKSLLFTANQLLGKEWSLGASYRLTQSVVHDDFPSVPNDLLHFPYSIVPHQRTEGLLQQFNLSAVYNHPSGFFAKAEAVWNNQHYSGYNAIQLGPTIAAGFVPRDDFWQFNAYIGYRAFHRRAEVTLGLLNLGDQNYSANSLNLYNQYPRGRTLSLSLRLNF